MCRDRENLPSNLVIRSPACLGPTDGLRVQGGAAARHRWRDRHQNGPVANQIETIASVALNEIGMERSAVGGGG
jgi:hypothetical protein